MFIQFFYLYVNKYFLLQFSFGAIITCESKDYSKWTRYVLTSFCKLQNYRNDKNYNTLRSSATLSGESQAKIIFF